MMKTKMWLVCLALFASLTRLDAQEGVPPQTDTEATTVQGVTPPSTLKPERYINFGYGLGITTMLNKNASPIAYSGGSMPLVLGYESYNPVKKKIFRYQMKTEVINFYDKFSVLQLLPTSISSFLGVGAPTNSYTYVDVNVDRLYFLTNIKKNEDLKVFLGYQIAGTTLIGNYANGYANSQSFPMVFADLAVKGELNYVFDKKKKWNFNYSLALPLAAMYIVPGFDNQPFTSGLDNGFNFIGKYFKLNSVATIGYKLSNRNLLSLSYRWQYLNNSLDYDIQRFQMTNDYLIFKLSYAL